MPRLGRIAKDWKGAYGVLEVRKEIISMGKIKHDSFYLILFYIFLFILFYLFMILSTKYFFLVFFLLDVL